MLFMILTWNWNVKNVFYIHSSCLFWPFHSCVFCVHQFCFHTRFIVYYMKTFYFSLRDLLMKNLLRNKREKSCKVRKFRLLKNPNICIFSVQWVKTWNSKNRQEMEQNIQRIYSFLFASTKWNIESQNTSSVTWKIQYCDKCTKCAHSWPPYEYRLRMRANRWPSRCTYSCRV